MGFKKAKREDQPIKVLIDGPTNSGKSYSSLLLAKGLAKGGKIGAYCTENGRLNYYAHLTDFDIDVMTKFTHDDYTTALKDAEKEGFSVLIIDGLTPMWKAALAFVDANSSNKQFNAWNPVKTGIYNFLVAVRESRMHIICTVRSKMTYVLEKNDSGKMAPVKVGMEPQFESNVEYEFDFGFSINSDHQYTMSKSMAEIDEIDQTGKITENTGVALLKWMNEGFNVNDEFLKLLGESEITPDEFLTFLKSNPSRANLTEIPRATKVRFIDHKDEAIKAFEEWKSSIEEPPAEEGENSTEEKTEESTQPGEKK